MKKVLFIYLLLIINTVFSSLLLKAEWEPVNNGIEKNSTSINKLIYSEKTLYAATSPLNHATYGLFKSIDFGENWEFLGLNNKYINSILKFGSNLFVGTTYDGVFFSSDEGKNWEMRNNGLKNFSNNPDKQYIPAYNLAKIGDTLFCAGINLYFSIDFGKTWTNVNVGPGKTVEDVYECNGQLFLNIWQYSPNYLRYVVYSSDRGVSWAFTNIQIDRTTNNEFVTLKNKIFFCNGSQDIFISDDNGQSWRSNTFTSPIVSISASGDTLFALSENGRLFYSIDLGEWFNIKNNNQIPFGENIYKAIIQEKLLSINR